MQYYAPFRKTWTPILRVDLNQGRQADPKGPQGHAVQIPDALADPEYTYGGQKLGGYRTLLGVPLLRDKSCIGVIALTRSKVQPFTIDKSRS
jgi:GAF domain-containing protein